jgi:hypothetical protein
MKSPLWGEVDEGAPGDDGAENWAISRRREPAGPPLAKNGPVGLVLLKMLRAGLT